MTSLTTPSSIQSITPNIRKDLQLLQRLFLRHSAYLRKVIELRLFFPLKYVIREHYRLLLREVEVLRLKTSLDAQTVQGKEQIIKQMNQQIYELVPSLISSTIDQVQPYSHRYQGIIAKYFCNLTNFIGKFNIKESFLAKLAVTQNSLTPLSINEFSNTYGSIGKVLYVLYVVFGKIYVNLFSKKIFDYEERLIQSIVLTAILQALIELVVKNEGVQLIRQANRIIDENRFDQFPKNGEGRQKVFEIELERLVLDILIDFNYTPAKL